MHLLIIYLEVTSHEPLIDSNSIIKVTSNLDTLKEYEHYQVSVTQPTPVIDHVPQVKLITPIAKRNKRQSLETDAMLSDDYYLKRHRRHEKEEKTQKNREKERLKHGYYQQKQLVERIKTMDKSLLQSIVSSIRHRTHQEGEEEEAYLNDLHCRLLNDAMDHLRRYELLGLNNNKQGQEDEHEWLDPSPVPTPTTSSNTKFKQALQSEAIKQRSRQIKSFSKQPMFAGDSIQRGSRRSTRHVIAFGQKLPEFDAEEFSLPYYILDWKNKP